MNTEPLKAYLAAIRTHEAGKDKEAEALLCESLGVKEATPYMKQTLSKLVDGENPSDAVLTLIIDRSKK